MIDVNTGLFKDFPSGRILDRLAFLDFAAESIPSPSAEAALLHAQKYPGMLVNDDEREELFIRLSHLCDDAERSDCHPGRGI